MYITEDTGDIFVDILNSEVAEIGTSRIQLNADQANSLRKRTVKEDNNGEEIITIETIDYDDVNNLINNFAGHLVQFKILETEIVGDPTQVDEDGNPVNTINNSRIDKLENRASNLETYQNKLKDEIVPELEKNLEDFKTGLDPEIEALKAKDLNLQGQIDLLGENLTAVSTTANDAKTNAADALSQISVLTQTQNGQLQNIQKAQADAAEALEKASDLEGKISDAEETIAALGTKDTELEGKFNDYLPLAGGNLTGSIALPNDKFITIPAAATENNHATNKAYVDSSITTATNNLTTAYQAADTQINNSISALDAKIGNNATNISSLNDDIKTLTNNINNKSAAIIRVWGD